MKYTYMQREKLGTSATRCCGTGSAVQWSVCCAVETRTCTRWCRRRCAWRSRRGWIPCRGQSLSVWCVLHRMEREDSLMSFTPSHMFITPARLILTLVCYEGGNQYFYLWGLLCPSAVKKKIISLSCHLLQVIHDIDRCGWIFNAMHDRGWHRVNSNQQKQVPDFLPGEKLETSLHLFTLNILTQFMTWGQEQHPRLWLGIEI